MVHQPFTSKARGFTSLLRISSENSFGRVSLLLLIPILCTSQTATEFNTIGRLHSGEAWGRCRLGLRCRPVWVPRPWLPGSAAGQHRDALVEMAGSLHSTCCHSAWLLITLFREHNIHNLGQIAYIGFVKAGQTKGPASRVCCLYRWPTLDVLLTYSCWCMDATNQESSQILLQQTYLKCFQHSLSSAHFPHSLRT